MKIDMRGWIALTLMAAVAACAPPRMGPADSATPASGGADLITRAEIDRGQWQDVYELVRNLRPRWIKSRGMTAMPGQAGGVQVYVDGTKLGGVHLLSELPTAAIQHLAWVDPVSAAGRWGSGHADGVIAVSYRSDGR